MSNFLTSLLGQLGFGKYFTAAKIIAFLIALRHWLVKLGVMKPLLDTTPVPRPNDPDRPVKVDDEVNIG